MKTETSSPSQKFADSVLALCPRIAVFECDGTLWSGDSGADFFYWQIDRGMFPHDVAERAAARYSDYKQGKVDEEVMCGEMVAIKHGNARAQSQHGVSKFLAGGSLGPQMAVPARSFSKSSGVSTLATTNGSLTGT